MIITRLWLQEFIDISGLSTSDICNTLNSIGLEVDKQTGISVPQHVVVGYVKNKHKHPNADKLSVCSVDIGEETLQIVCGANNVRVNQFVAVAKVGCCLSDSFHIKPSKLRGVDSMGMICSAEELGFNTLNDGILELDDSIGKLELGKELSTFSLLNDEVIEIELTANRGDCLSIQGVARELSAYHKLPLNEFEKKLNCKEIAIGQLLEISCDSNINASLLYKAIDFSEFSLPLLQAFRLGIINKYVRDDIVNVLEYTTHTTGVLLSAYGENQIGKTTDRMSLNIRKNSEGFDSVYGKQDELSVIGIKNNCNYLDSTTFIIEANYIEPDLLSRRVYDNTYKTGDIFYRSSRGSEPNILKGMDYFGTLVSHCGATVYKGIESFIEDKENTVIDLNMRHINAIIGQSTPKAKIENILNSLGFKVKDSSDNVLSITVPLHRHDVSTIADITEEIIRMIGIDNIKSKPLSIEESNRTNTVSVHLSKINEIRHRCISNGFFETLHYVFTSKSLLSQYGFEAVHSEKDLVNPINNDLDTFRTTLLIGLVQAVSHNIKLDFKQVAFFEIGTVFTPNREEKRKISFIHSGPKEHETLKNRGKPDDLTLFEFAEKLVNSIGQFELRPLKSIPNGFVHPYQNADVIVNNRSIGYLAKLHPVVAKNFDLPQSFIAELDLNAIKTGIKQIKAFSKFQMVRRDLSLITPKTMPYSDIVQVINDINNPLIRQFNLVDTYSDERFEDKQSLTLRFVLQSDSKTLEEKEISETMQIVLDTLNERLSIGLREV